MAENRAAPGGIPLACRDFAAINGGVRGKLDQPAPQMKLAYNIDQRGKKARLKGGIIAALCGIVLMIWGALAGSRTMLVIGILLLITGAFMIFEGARGWCALRAIGIKTPM
jgi:hypothetical protein